jgi:hypothetical protein
MGLVLPLCCAALSLAAETGMTLDGGGAANSKTPVLSVCEAIARRQELADKIVSIRGLVRGTMEGTWLDGNGDCDGPLVTNGYRWDMVIWLEASRSAYLEKHLDFAYDQRAFEAVDRQFKRKARGKRDVPIVLTYTGLLYTYRDLSEHVVAYPNGQVRGFGFGHGGIAPVALLVKTVSDLELLDKPR